MDLDLSSSPQVYLNLNVRGMQQSATLRINEQCAAIKASGRDVFKLGLGQSPFPVPEAVVQCLRDNAPEKDYLPVKGLPALRESITGYMSRTQGLDYSAENILVGPGTKELMFLLQLVYYGDLIIPSPSWVSYAPQAHIIGRHLQWIPTDIETGLGVTPERLEELCRQDPERPRLLILNYPGNPSGMTYSESQLKAIAEVARKYRLLLLSDEIYGALTFDGTHRSIARYYPEGTIVSNGLSKWCGAGGWRLGAFVFPESLNWLMNGMAAVASETFTSTSAPIQYAAVAAFDENPQIEEYLHAARRTLKGIGNFFADRMRACGATLSTPQGAFYLFPNFSHLAESFRRHGIHTNEQFCTRLLEDTGVAVLPGNQFGRPDQELSARMAYVDFDGAATLRAIGEHDDDYVPDEDFLAAHCGRVFEAANRVTDWINGNT